MFVYCVECAYVGVQCVFAYSVECAYVSVQCVFAYCVDCGCVFFILWSVYV